MDVEDTEQLFLLEVLVDNVHISRSCIFVDKCGGPINTQLTTVFQFLKFPPLEIKEKSYQQKGDEPPSFRTGKSCLFAIPSKKLVDFSKLFNVNVSVLRRFPAGVLPEKRVIGETTVDISSDFAYVVTEVLTNPQVIPKSQSLRESYRLRSPSTAAGGSAAGGAVGGGGANYVGSISLFLRISCFGKLIVNEFQLSGESSVALVDGATSSGASTPGAAATAGPTAAAGTGGGGEAWRGADVTEINPVTRPMATVSARPSIVCVGAGEFGAEEKEQADADKKSVVHAPTRPPLLRGAPLAPVTAATANVVRYDPLTRGLVLNLLQPDVAAGASGETLQPRPTPRVPPTRAGRRRSGRLLQQQQQQLQLQLQQQQQRRRHRRSGTQGPGGYGDAF